MPHRLIAPTIWMTFAVAVAAAVGQSPSQPDRSKPRSNATSRGGWEMEALHRKDGKIFYGLLRRQEQDEIEFVQVVRSPGKPMYLVVHYYPPRSVEKITRLPETQQAELRKRIGPLLLLRSRARIEAGRMEDVALDEVTEDEIRYRRFQGPWFTLHSTADEETTRRCVVRITQVFQAYRQAMPPGPRRRDDLRIVLYGSMDQYRTQLNRWGLKIDHPAFYSARKNIIYAGSDLSRYSQRLAEIRAVSDMQRRQYERMAAELPKKLGELSREMKRKGFSNKEIREEIRIRNAAWKRQYEAALAELKRIDRSNDAKFAEVTRRMFTRLYHEAFHAYLENHAFPGRRMPVPRWLNEGLAQVFENGQLDEDTLRIDAPHRTALRRLQDDLRSGAPLPLAELLSAGADRFLQTHDASSSQRQYLYAWGVAYYLMFRQNLLDSAALHDYLSPASEKLSPFHRFEKLVGSPLPDFERQWRRTMLSLKPAPR